MSREPSVLWITSEIHLPARGGAAQYSQGLMRSLADRGLRVEVLGASLGDPPTGSCLKWDLLRERRTRAPWRMLSLFPAMTTRLPLSALRRRLKERLREGFEIVVLDHVMAVWALPAALHAVECRTVNQLWYVSQNDELAVARTAVLDRGERTWRRVLRAVDYPRIRRAQLSLLASSDLVLSITEEDARSLRRQGAGSVCVARPGPPANASLVGPAAVRPRAILVAGSFLWRLKMRNLEEFLNVARAPAAAAGVEILVVGRMMTADCQRLRRRFPSIRVVGEVDDFSQMMAEARIAVVPELLGGGFKMKFLDFIFAGLPVATLQEAAAGLPLTPGVDFLCSTSLTDLIESTLHLIDQPETLDVWSERALEKCRAEFDWAATGELLQEAYEGLRRHSLPKS